MGIGGTRVGNGEHEREIGEEEWEMGNMSGKLRT